MDEQIKNILKASYDQSKETRDRSDIIGWKMREITKALHHMPQETDNCKLLDLGAGSGLYGAYFQDQGIDVTCIDLSSSMIDLCKEKGLNAKIMDFYNLDFNSSTFDVVWSLNTLLHVPKKSIHKVFEGITKVLKPNGLFYLGLYGGANSEGIWEEDFYEPKRFFSFYEDDALKELVERHFTVENFETFAIENNRNFNFQSILARRIR